MDSFRNVRTIRCLSLMSSSSIIVEVCVDSVESVCVHSAVEAGANRLELCGNLGLGGGSTPSLGLFKTIRQSVKVPIMVMIRPRFGDFLYSDAEIDVMLEDIGVFKNQNAPPAGIVVGVLTADGRVATDRMKQIMEVALPMEVCFHRAFDMTRDPLEALRDIRAIGGISRILTSGQTPRALDALDALKSLFVEARASAPENGLGSLTIMPGSGINGETIEAILEALLPYGLLEVHLSGGRWIDSGMTFRRVGMGMGIGGDAEWGIWRTLVPLVVRVREVTEAKVKLI